MARRYYSNTAVDTTLDGAITSGALSLVVVSATGFPTAPFAIVIDEGQATEEVILVGAKAGTTFSTLTRGFDGTSAAAHDNGASVKFVLIAADLDDAGAHRWDTPAAAGDADTATGIHHTVEKTAGNYSTQAIGDAASAGTSNKAATADHKHGMPSFAAPTGGVDIGDAASAGAAATLARSDHQHAFTAPSAGYPVNVADTEADGSATTPARSDHRHALGQRTYFYAELSANQSIPNGAATTVLFPEVTDAGAGYDPTTGIYTAPSAGLYLVTVNITWDNNSTGARETHLVHDGTNVIAESQIAADGTSGQSLSILRRLSAGATLQVQVTQSSGGALNATSVASNFAAVRVGDL